MRCAIERFLQQVIERAAAEIDAAFERAVDADVEPAFDALAEELHRHGVNQSPRKDRDHDEKEHQAQREPRAEHAALEVASQSKQLPADDEHQQEDQHSIQNDERDVSAREERRVGRCGREEKQRNAR